MIVVDLQDLRKQIDEIDIQIQRLFEMRMDIVRRVAAFKKENNLPVLQSGREEEILARVTENAAPGYADCDKALFANMMDISKCSQKKLMQADTPYLADSVPFFPEKAKKVACQGVSGAYSHIAARRLFGDDRLCFYPNFEDVFQAVISHETDYGVLPIENSNAGSVTEVYELLKKYNIFIAKRIKIKVEHCLAAPAGTMLSDITDVYSHEQGLQQCSAFIRSHHLNTHSCSNTAVSARLVAASADKGGEAAICSKLAAEQNGLIVIEENIANNNENYTRFLVISAIPHYLEQDDIISVSFSLPHVTGSLYRMLTKFYVYQINMLKIESKPIGNKDFDIMFYLDFSGNLKDKNVTALLNDLDAELIRFKYLGSYSEME